VLAAYIALDHHAESDKPNCLTSSTVLGSIMSVQDDLDPNVVGFEFIKEGSDWLAIFNPKVPRQMDVRLTNRLIHEKCVSFCMSLT
jgi:hypothetical protein